jgi:glycosyltransferase involved in cell wall biosynthesis
MNHPKITAIIPARNEEKTIAEIIKSVLSLSLIDELIVVNSDSTDRTVEVVENLKKISPDRLRLINIENLGKGRAMKVGAENASGKILLFLDADLVGLTSDHIQKLTQPLLEKTAAMCVGLKTHRGKFITWMMKTFLPLIGGERAIFASHFKKIIQNKLIKGFSVEVIMNAFCRKHKLPIKKVVLEGLSHQSKMKKRGFLEGVFANLRMFSAIFFIYLRLKFQRKNFSIYF